MYRLKIKKEASYKEVTFLIPYMLFWFGCFFQDIEQTTFNFVTIGSLLRKLSYVISLLFLAIQGSCSVKSFGHLIGLALFGIVPYITTGHTSFLGIVLLSVLSDGITDKKIVKTSLDFLLIGLISVLLLNVSGALQNLDTSRDGINVRNTFGFYHSNVLPLVYMYLISYFLLLRKKTTVLQFIVLTILLIMINILCDSRSSFLCAFGLLLISICPSTIRRNQYVQKAVCFGAQWVVPQIQLNDWD